MDNLSRQRGSHVDGLVLALVDAAYDKKLDVRDDMTSALHNLGRRQPELVLRTCNLYLLKHQKLIQGHRILLLDMMTKIIRDADIALLTDLSKDLISLASNELTKSKEVIPEWQTAASHLLVALGVKFSQDVMIEMLQKINPGTLPHYFVVLTLANLAKETVFGVVPFLKDIFSRMLSMLGMAKTDNMRWVFATCFGAFSEAILEYCANIESAPYPDIAKDRFQDEIFTAFEIMFNIWLNNSKEGKVRLAVVEAFGHMSHLLAKAKLEDYIQRLLQAITNLYRKQTEHYIITQALCLVLDAASSDGSLMLLNILDQMLQGLHIQAANEPDFMNPMSIKNHNEVLRCFQVLAKAFSDRVVSFLQLKLEQSNDKIRCASLSILKHLINSSDSHLSSKKEVILSSVTILLHETNMKVCRSFAQCIIAMAHHNYLGLEGGEKLIEFIIRMCALTEIDKTNRRGTDVDMVTSSAVKSMCENILHLMATTIDVMENVLWPYLLEFLLPVQYTESLLAVCKSLAVIANRKRENKDETFLIEYNVSVNVPKSPALFARLLIVIGHPLKGSCRGVHILTFLKAYSPNIHKNIVEMWDTVIPKLIIYLEENMDDAKTWNQKAWEDLILKLLAKTLSEVDSEEWFLALGREMGNQIPLYQSQSDEKNFLYKCLGVVLRKTGTTDFIREHLNLIFSSVDHNIQLEREGCAVGVGFCAASHLDQCLMKLEEITKTQMIRKSTGFMGLIKDKSEADVERIKSTVMLCYGYVVFYGPPSLICSRLETNVLRVINPHFGSVRDSSVKFNLIRAVELIGKAAQPSHMQNDEFVFKRRGDLMKHMQNFLKSESKSVITETRSYAIDAITNLVKLKPPLNEMEMQELVIVCSCHVYPVLSMSHGSPSGPGHLSPLNRAVKDVTLSQEEQEKSIKLALNSLNGLMKEISNHDPRPAPLHSLFKLIEPYLISCHDHERLRVLQSMKDILNNYVAVTNYAAGIHFTTLGAILGRLLPRCTDPLTHVRQDSVDCIQLLLTINDRYEGVPANINDERIQVLTQLRETLSKSEPSVLFNIVNELSLVVSKKTPDEQLKTLVFSLIDGLRDMHSQSSSGACALLNCLMKFRGAELAKEVRDIVHGIVDNLQSVTFSQTVIGSLIAMRTLATHHLILVLQAFLEFTIPYKSCVGEFWRTLAKDKDLTSDTLEHMLELLQRTPPYTESEDRGKAIRIVSSAQFSISAALFEIFQVGDTEPLLVNLFAKLLSALLLKTGGSIGLSVPSSEQKKNKEDLTSPLILNIKCLKEFINGTKFSGLKQQLEEKNCWENLEDSTTFVKALQDLVVVICECNSSCVSDIVTSLLPSLSSPYDSYRMVTAAIFSELINQRCCGDMQLVELLMNSLLSKLVDSSHHVRQLCIQGLGNMASVGGQKLQSYSTTILSAMMAGMDDKEDPDMKITLEAMSGLSRILSLLDESSVRQILINICLRIRPCFEKENSYVRAAAISLFGDLARFGHGHSEASFLEQIHTNIISILLHLNEEQNVTKACKLALRAIGPRLDSSAMNNMFQKHLIEDGHLHYGEFMNDLSRLMIADYLDKMNFYIMACISFFKSNWDDIRANAALFVGFLLGNLKKSQRDSISVDHCCGALVVLLKDPSPSVRSRAAEAISLLHDY